MLQKLQKPELWLTLRLLSAIPRRLEKTVASLNPAVHTGICGAQQGLGENRDVGGGTRGGTPTRLRRHLPHSTGHSQTDKSIQSGVRFTLNVIAFNAV